MYQELTGIPISVFHLMQLLKLPIYELCSKVLVSVSNKIHKQSHYYKKLQHKDRAPFWKVHIFVR
jgi:hypothetical protein